MQGYCLTCDIEIFRNGIKVKGFFCKKTNDLRLVGIGYGLKDVPPGFNLCKHLLANIICKQILAKYFLLFKKWPNSFLNGPV
jgi:hypothetical protein